MSQENKLNDLDRYQQAAGRTANMDIERVLERLNNNPQLVALLNDALGLAGEAGEFADHIKKVVYHGHELDEEYLAKELGDKLWYIADAARNLLLALSTVAGMNVNKLKERYPDGFDEQKSINRGDK
jgi:NTP pyrophosphatase (non-canonical NTP hydrolase)